MLLCAMGWGQKYFLLVQGSPQGSLLGGKFFNLSMDRVLNSLQEKGLGCYVNTIFAEAVA